MQHSGSWPRGVMTLRDHQPDVLFQGDSLERGRHRALAEVDFLTRNIATELCGIARTTDAARRGAARIWILDAQRRRRNALAHAAAYRRLIAERERMTALLPLSERGLAAR